MEDKMLLIFHANEIIAGFPRIDGSGLNHISMGYIGTSF